MNAATSPTGMRYALLCPLTALTRTTNAAPTTAAAALSAPKTTTTANHGRLAASGSNAEGLNDSACCASSPPPRPASIALTVKISTFSTRMSMPTALAPSSLSRIAISARPSAPERRLYMMRNAIASIASSNR